jgi:hypothetical protein
VLIRWEGARSPLVWTVPAPEIDAIVARVDAARRFLHVFGPSTAPTFGDWLGISVPQAHAAFEALEPELTDVLTPAGERSILAADELLLRAAPADATSTRVLPSGDAYYQFWGADRELLVPDARRRAELWTARVWPGAVLIGRDIVGVWRRDQHRVTIDAWRRLTDGERMAVEAEAASLPLPALRGAIRVDWNVLE